MMPSIKRKRCNRSTIIIAGALFVSPLAAAAFRSPSSPTPVINNLASSSSTSSRKNIRTCIRPRSTKPFNASILKDSLDAEETAASSIMGQNNNHNMENANDIMNHAVEQHHSQQQQANGVNGFVSNLEDHHHHTNNIGPAEELELNGAVELEQQKEQLHKQLHHQHQNSQKSTSSTQTQRQINKSRKNNKAMADPDFLRKRTESLLRKTKNDSYNENHFANILSSGSAGSLKVDKRTFDWLIDAWSYSGEYDASDYALSLLTRMEELSVLQPSLGVSPDVKSYTKVINAIARSGRSDAGEQAEGLLERMIEDHGILPNTYTYTYVIDAYSRSASPKSPHAAQRLVEEMERLRAEGDPDVWPTTRAWNSVIAAWAQWKGEEMAWGHIGSGAERAEACLDIMEEWADTTGNEDVRPNFYNYNSVISALANSDDEGAAFRAEMILERMENLYRTTGDDNVKPRTSTYNAIIDAWAKSGEVDAANRAELLLAHMMELYETGHNLDAKPNVRSFNSVLNAWAKSGHPEAPIHASDVLSRMEELSENSELEVSPDATSFATAINAFARSHSFGKAQHAYDLFLHMQELYDTSGKRTLRPNNVHYNSVLNACAFSFGDLEEQSQAMEIANAMLVGMNESPYSKPDHVTYGTYLKVINNQMPPSDARDQVAETVFRRCAKDGMVGEMVLRQLREMGMEEVYESLMGGSMWGNINLSDLPPEWTCNVIEGKRMRRWKFRR